MGFINDTYMVDNINNIARQKPGTFSTTFNFTGFEQANKLTTGKRK